MNKSREEILQSTCAMLENQGFHATGLNEIARESGAPKGSIYYYFPEGKEEIIAESVLFAGPRTTEYVRLALSNPADPAKAVKNFLETIAYHVEFSNFQSGGLLTIVAAESATTSERINRVCQKAYADIRQVFSEKLLSAGIEENMAVSLAWMINAAIEGAVILSCTYHSGDPLREAGSQLACLLRNCQVETISGSDLK
jgi:TetR/AcrR family transcriptional regulator, lmrAB and yxaGH operons repressor